LGSCTIQNVWWADVCEGILAQHFIAHVFNGWNPLFLSSDANTKQMP